MRRVRSRCFEKGRLGVRQVGEQVGRRCVGAWKVRSGWGMSGGRFDKRRGGSGGEMIVGLGAEWKSSALP